MKWKIGIAIVVLLAVGATHYTLTRAPVPIVASSTPTVLSEETEVSVPAPVAVSAPAPVQKENPVFAPPDIATLSTGIVPRNDYEQLVYQTFLDARAALDVDIDNYDAWLTVGLSFKQLARYDAARAVFEYASIKWPMEAVSYANLGSLYHLYLKDFPKSETAYGRAIAVDPYQAAWYRGLYELYRYSYKQDTAAWEETLKAGTAETNDAGLWGALANRYAELGRFAEAVAAYDAAIAAAEQVNDERAVELFIAERAAARERLP